MKLALIGKSISHSRSEEIYKKLLNNKVEYTYLDISDEASLPSLDELFSKFDGISITSPYKSSYFSHVSTSSELERLKIINAIRFSNKQYQGVLTDLSAFREIFKSLNDKSMNIKILGDGSMGRMVAEELKRESIRYQVYSRKLNNLDKISNEAAFLINTCSRDYVFSNQINSQSCFWDFNYSFDPHQELRGKCNYIDGLSLLEKQAQHALNFWQSK